MSKEYICNCCGADLSEVGICVTATGNIGLGTYLNNETELSNLATDYECAECNSSLNF